MTSETDLIAQSASFCGMVTGGQVLDTLQAAFKEFGANHILISGMPFPGRPIDPSSRVPIGAMSIISPSMSSTRLVSSSRPAAAMRWNSSTVQR